MRIGIGYDVHKLAKDRKLILGGIEIPYEKGLLGWSDGDVLVHTIIDALIGAMGEGDIGKHFPPGDLTYKGISSLKLLEFIRELLRYRGYVVGNIDATVVAEEPRLEPYIDQIKKSIGETLGISEKQINIKAKTEEGLGFTGSKEGIKAYAVCLLKKEL